MRFCTENVALMFMTIFSAPSLTDRLSLSLLGLRAAVADRIAGNAVSVALMTLIYFKLQRIENRILWLIAAIREGRLRGSWLCPGRASAVRAEGSRRPEVWLPRGFAWLVRLVPYKAAGFGSQLRHLFGDPEFVALLAASPQLRSTLRPLCRMLGIEPEVISRLVLPEVVFAAKAESEVERGPDPGAPNSCVPDSCVPDSGAALSGDLVSGELEWRPSDGVRAEVRSPGDVARGAASGAGAAGHVQGVVDFCSGLNNRNWLVYFVTIS